MTDAVNVLLVETDELELHERVQQLLMDGYAVDAVGAADQAKIRLAEDPDALILCGEPQTIGLLRDLRAGAIPRADSATPVLVVGADDDSAAVRYYRAGADVNDHGNSPVSIMEIPHPPGRPKGRAIIDGGDACVGLLGFSAG